MRWPNDNWTRVEVYRLVYGHLPSRTGDTITRKTIEEFCAGVRDGRMKSPTIDVSAIANEMKTGRFLISSRYVEEGEMSCNKCGPNPSISMCIHEQMEAVKRQMDNKLDRIAELEAELAKCRWHRAYEDAEINKQMKRALRVDLEADNIRLQAELATLRTYCAGEQCRSDYQTAGDMRKHLEIIKADNTRLRSSLKQLVDRLDQVHDSDGYRAVWSLWMLHNGFYTGPQYAFELEAAKNALKEGE